MAEPLTVADRYLQIRDDLWAAQKRIAELEAIIATKQRTVIKEVPGPVQTRTVTRKVFVPDESAINRLRGENHGLRTELKKTQDQLTAARAAAKRSRDD